MPYFLKILKIFIFAKLLSDSVQILHAHLFTLFVVDIVNGFENFGFNSEFRLRKISKNLSVRTKMLIFTRDGPKYRYR